MNVIGAVSLRVVYQFKNPGGENGTIPGAGALNGGGVTILGGVGVGGVTALGGVGVGGVTILEGVGGVIVLEGVGGVTVLGVGVNADGWDDILDVFVYTLHPVAGPIVAPSFPK